MSCFYLNNEDVVSTGMSDSTFAFGLGSTFTTLEVITAARQVTAFGAVPIAHSQWFSESGVKCRVLRANGLGWQSGKIRFRLEFIPDNQLTQENASQVQSIVLDDFRSDLEI